MSEEYNVIYHNLRTLIARPQICWATVCRCCLVPRWCGTQTTPPRMRPIWAKMVPMLYMHDGCSTYKMMELIRWGRVPPSQSMGLVDEFLEQYKWNRWNSCWGNVQGADWQLYGDPCCSLRCSCHCCHMIHLFSRVLSFYLFLSHESPNRGSLPSRCYLCCLAHLLSIETIATSSAIFSCWKDRVLGRWWSFIGLFDDFEAWCVNRFFLLSNPNHVDGSR